VRRNSSTRAPAGLPDREDRQKQLHGRDAVSRWTANEWLGAVHRAEQHHDGDDQDCAASSPSAKSDSRGKKQRDGEIEQGREVAFRRLGYRISNATVQLMTRPNIRREASISRPRVGSCLTPVFLNLVHGGSRASWQLPTRGRLIEASLLILGLVISCTVAFDIPITQTTESYFPALLYLPIPLLSCRDCPILAEGELAAQSWSSPSWLLFRSMHGAEPFVAVHRETASLPCSCFWRSSRSRHPAGGSGRGVAAHERSVERGARPASATATIRWTGRGASPP